MKDLKTPYFLIDEAVLCNYWDMLENSLKAYWGNFLIGYSFKTNSLPWLVKYMQSRGAFAEVVSDDEYLLARHLGYENKNVIYNGPYKERDSFNSVLLSGGLVNMDSFREINWLRILSENNPEKEFGIGIRVNFDLEKMCPGETTMGDESGRFGFCLETGQFKEALDLISGMKNVKVKGLHLHSSTKSRSIRVFKCIAETACRLKIDYDLDLSYVDIGGGYCGGIEGRPEYPDYFSEICMTLGKSFDPGETKLVVEPGISLISKCTTFVSTVLEVKEVRKTNYVITDGSRFNLDPTMIKNSYFYHVEPCDDVVRDVVSRQVITGFSCMEADRLFEMENKSLLKEGDRIIYENVGGYTMSLNPLFIQYFPDVYVLAEKEMIKVRRKWTPDDYVAGSSI